MGGARYDNETWTKISLSMFFGLLVLSIPLFSRPSDMFLMCLILSAFFEIRAARRTAGVAESASGE